MLTPLLICIVFGAWMSGELRGKPIAKIVDPAFGTIQWFENRGWEGMITFEAAQERISLSIEADSAGPTDDQRQLFDQITKKYDSILPAVEKHLSKYVSECWDAHGWDFTLIGINIPGDCRTRPWTAEYVAPDTDQDGDMGYAIHVLNWAVTGVDAGD